VAAILATAETLEQALQDDMDAARRFAATLLTDARRLGELVTDLLDLSRFEKGPSMRERVSLSDVVRRESDAMRASLERKGLEAEVSVSDRIFVLGDADDLALVVRNLLDNALRYTEEGRVTVALSKNNGNALLEVGDTGLGIPAKDLPRIFERFYRVDKARSRETGGTGIGLSIVRHIVESAGGVVDAESQLGRGSRFTVTLPLSP
jgi:signal transduction histidine kinase